MPLNPLAWFVAILFFALLVADIIFGIVSAGSDDGWSLWGPILAVVFSWIIAFVGSVFTIFILRIVKLLSVIYLLGFIVLAVASGNQGEWGSVGIGVGGAVVTLFVGGALIAWENAFVNASLRQRYAENA